MAVNWTGEVLAQVQFYWEYSLWPRLEGLTDAEYHWLPAPGAWTVRQGADGRYQPDSAVPEPEPPPVTTIAWRLGHLVVDVLETRTNWHFGDRTYTRESVNWPGDAVEAKQRLRHAYEVWSEHIQALDEDGLSAPVRGTEAPQWAGFPTVALVLHVNREIIHHGAEIALLRDLYRAQPSRS